MPVAAAGLDTSAVQVHIINDKRINAFVSNGMQIFIHTGLLTEAKNPNEVIGVIAHETGHIAGGHLAQLRDRIGRDQTKSLLIKLLGIGLIVSTREQLEERGLTLKLASVPAFVEKTFKVMSLTEVFERV